MSRKNVKAVWEQVRKKSFFRLANWIVQKELQFTIYIFFPFFSNGMECFVLYVCRIYQVFLTANVGHNPAGYCSNCTKMHFDKSPVHLDIEMVFCYQNCSNLLWEKIALVIEKNLWKSRLKAKNLQIFWDH